MKWQAARQQDKVSEGDRNAAEWALPSAPDDSRDTRTISEKIRDGEIGQG